MANLKKNQNDFVIQNKRYVKKVKCTISQAWLVWTHMISIKFQPIVCVTYMTSCTCIYEVAVASLKLEIRLHAYQVGTQSGIKSNISDVPWRLRFAWCGRIYEVVYGSPCGRPEKVCLFIPPWLALRTGLVLKRTVVILSWVALKRTWTQEWWRTINLSETSSPSSF